MCIIKMPLEIFPETFYSKLSLRQNLENDCNGHHKLGCVIFNKNTQCLLRIWV